MAERVLKLVADEFVTQGKSIEFRADDRAFGFLPGNLTKRAVPDDFDTEFLDYILAVKVVDSIDEAICHINCHGSHHTDCIITENKEVSSRVTKGVFFIWKYMRS